MDETLDGLWKTGNEPFGGDTLYLSWEEEVCVKEGIKAISAALTFLESKYAECNLYSLDDWHEHDGFGTYSQPTSFGIIRSHLATPEAFVLNHSDDTLVYRAIYPDNLKFLLRYCLWEADGKEQEPADQEVSWTFSGDKTDISEVMQLWSTYDLEIETSVEYFRSRYSG